MSAQRRSDVFRSPPIGVLGVAVLTAAGATLLGSVDASWVLVGLTASLAVIGSP